MKMDRLLDMGAICIIGLVVIVLVGVGSRLVKGSDNEIEEKIEDLIKEKTDYDVDLSPDNPDPDDN